MKAQLARIAIAVTMALFLILALASPALAQVADATSADIDLGAQGIGRSEQMSVQRVDITNPTSVGTLALNIDCFAVDNKGTAGDADVTLVEVYEDTNASGVWDAGDALVGSAANFTAATAIGVDDGAACLSVADAGTATVFVVVTTAASPTEGNTSLTTLDGTDLTGVGDPWAVGEGIETATSATTIGFNLTAVACTPANADAGATTNHVIGFTTSAAGDLTATGHIKVTYPAGFDVSGVAVIGSTGFGGAPAFIVAVVGQEVDITIGGTGILAVSTAATVTISPIVNTTVSGTTYTVSVQTEDPAGTVIDGPNNSADFTINPGPAAAFNVVTSGGGTETAGTAFNLTLTAVDAYGNTCDSGPNAYNGAAVPIDFTSTATASPNGTAPTIPTPQTLDFSVTPGIATATGFILTNAGETPTITATHGYNGYISSISGAITVNPGAINYYTVTSASYNQKAGVAFTVTVTAYDQYGNMVTTDSTTSVTMTSNSATMRFDSNGNGIFGQAGDNIQTLNAGTFNIPARDTISGRRIITATDPCAKTGISPPYTISGWAGQVGRAPTPLPAAPAPAVAPPVPGMPVGALAGLWAAVVAICGLIIWLGIFRR